MLFVILGVVMLGMSLAGMEPVAHWPQWAAAVPFAAALVWWTLADYFGLTQRGIVRRADARRAQRRRKAMEAMGLAAFEGRRPAPKRAAAAPRRTPAEAFQETLSSVVDTLTDLAEPPAVRRVG